MQRVFNRWWEVHLVVTVARFASVLGAIVSG